MKWFAPASRWPVAIAAVLLLDVAVGVVLIRLANADRHFAVEPDYYRRALGWDSTQVQARRNAALGWQVVPSLGALGTAGGVPLELRLTDRTGAPILDATIVIEARRVAHASAADTLTLAATAVPGSYLAIAPFRHAGLHELRIVARAGADRFTALLRLDAATNAPATAVVVRRGDAPPR